MYLPMELEEDSSEKIRYDTPHYPVNIRRSFLSDYPNYGVLNHWHEDIEMIAVLSGEMEYSINGKILSLKKGQGLVINAGQMHFGFSRKKTECDFICILVHPDFLCPLPSFKRDFVDPIIRNQRFSYLFLEQDFFWKQRIYEKILYLYNGYGEKTAPLKVLYTFGEIWELLFENLSADQDKSKKEQKSNRDLGIVRDMVSFIQENYGGKVTLEEIAAAGAVGQSKCCKLFSRFFFQSPVMYLTQYRLTKSIELLLHTDQTIIEIALSVGFGSASYYAETFHKWMGKSPSAYRKAAENKDFIGL